MRDKILSFLIILCICVIVAPTIPVVSIEQISHNNESPSNRSNPDVINQELSEHFFENLGQLDEMNFLYYGRLAEGFVGICETELIYWKDNQEYVVLSDITNPRGIKRSSFTSNYLLGNRGDYKCVKSYECIVVTQGPEHAELTFKIRSESLVVQILTPTIDGCDILCQLEDNLNALGVNLLVLEESCDFSVSPPSTSYAGSSYPLLFSTYLGGPGIDGSESFGINGVADEDGNTYIATHSTYPGYPISFEVQNTYSDVCVFKINSTGFLEYVTFIGGSNSDEGVDIAVDETGNLYVIGTTKSSDFPLLNPIYPTMDGTSDLFILSLDSTGSNLRYSTYFPLGSGGPVLSMKVDMYGCMYIAGFGVESASFPLVNPCEEVYDLSTRGFLTKVNYTGTELVFSTLIGIGQNTISDVNVDLDGNVYICGSTYASTLLTKNALDPNYSGKLEAFIYKFNSTGNGLIYGTYFGGEENDVATAVAPDSEGNLYVGGYASANNFEITYSFGTNNFRRSAYILKIDSEGGFLYSTQVGGFQDDRIRDICVNASGFIYAGGVTGSADFPTKNAYDSVHNGGSEAWEIWDCFVFQLVPTGDDIVYSTYVGGSHAEGVSRLSLTSDGRIIAVGRTESDNFPMVNPIDGTHEENEDLFVFKLGNSTDIPPTITAPQTDITYTINTIKETHTTTTTETTTTTTITNTTTTTTTSTNTTQPFLPMDLISLSGLILGVGVVMIMVVVIRRESRLS